MMKKYALNNYQLLQELYLMLDDSDRRVLREFDLTNRQYHALQHLSPGTNRYLTELSDLLFCDKSNVTGLVERMVRDRYVTRNRSQKDRRYRTVSITEEGNRLREASCNAHEASIEKRFSELTKKEQIELNRLLNKLVSGMKKQLQEERS